MPKARAVAVVLVMVTAASCAAAPAPTPTRGPAAVFVIPTELPNGRAELTIASSYPISTPVTIPITVSVARGTITGPVTARVLASGINEGGAPAEVLVRQLAVTTVSVSSGRGSTTVTWDTRDQKGVLVPADAYSLILEFRSTDGAGATITKAGATLELR